MNIFEKIVQFKTEKKNLNIKAVYVENSTWNGEWTYFVYCYDLVHHTFYINDLDKCINQYRTSVTNIIENIVNNAYTKEMNSITPFLKEILTSKKPIVYYIHKHPLTKEIITDKIVLQAVENEHWKIKKFKNPRWDNPLENTLKILGIK